MLLLKPTNRLQEIAYMNVIPCYYPHILEEYEAISPGSEATILNLINKNITHLKWSRAQYPELTDKEWEEHLASLGWNVWHFTHKLVN